MSIRQLSKFYGCPDPWDHREADNSQYGVIVELTPSRGGGDGQRPGDVRPRGVGGGGRRVGVFSTSRLTCACACPFSPPPLGPRGVWFVLLRPNEHFMTIPRRYFLCCSAPQKNLLGAHVIEAAVGLHRHTMPLDVDPFALQAAYNIRGLGWLAAVCGDGVMLPSDIHSRAEDTYPPT